ncbi:hypothetical protein L228DRAFT_279203 [Xylona heveae TC161]|uniref:DNA mismatch repair protein n=1 Tax=Xylona heveae (strain CBS 132557 / TC161) TaxID=1328760 RepID=A0A165J9P3_XYLHT|nr:hypothetical protein L228DRAFT_279203 [Xylona heveae TC161]KZF25941.1 hypothetical protein L228DRAFT_279203 [Xylona heveae TC161]
MLMRCQWLKTFGFKVSIYGTKQSKTLVAQFHTSPSSLGCLPLRPRTCPTRYNIGQQSSGIRCRRGAKTKSTIQLKDLPQGPLPGLDSDVTLRHGASAKSRRGKKTASVTEGDHPKIYNRAEQEFDVITGHKNEHETVTLFGSQPVQDVEDTELPRYPTVVQQAWNNMRKFENCVLLTRVGGFYELYFEHAKEFGPLLNLKVAQKKTSAGLVPMAGFPFFQLDRFLKMLVQDLNCSVAISEEFPNNASGKVKSGGLMFDRKVTRIVTPGTLIDERFLDPFENNFLLSLHFPGPLTTLAVYGEGLDHANISIERDEWVNFPVGLAWLDLSTGDFFTQTTSLLSLPSAISRIGPREVILDQALQGLPTGEIPRLLGEDGKLFSYHAGTGYVSSTADWAPLLEGQPLVAENEFTREEIAAGNQLLDYVTIQLQGLRMKLQPPLRRQELENMAIDRSSMRALEIKATMREGFFKGSLLHAIRRTVTNSGARLLRQWLSSPSTSLNVINSRLDLVSFFIDYKVIRERIVILLKGSYDSQRLVQKFALGRGDADDLVSLARTIDATSKIAASLSAKLTPELDSRKGDKGDRYSTENAQTSDACLASILKRLDLDGPLSLSAQITEAIDEDGLTFQHELEESEAFGLATMAQGMFDEGQLAEQVDPKRKRIGSKRQPKFPTARDEDSIEQEAWIMRRTASRLLEKLHQHLDELREEKVTLAETLREEHGASTLTLRWTPGLGYICHIRGKDLKSTQNKLSAARSISSSKSTRSFHLHEWTELGSRIDQVKLQIKGEEQNVFQGLREQVILNIVKLRRNAAVLDELDVACSFAALAEEQNLVRPILNLGLSHKIIGGRHPTVAWSLQEQGRGFTSNDCSVGLQERVWLLTGPNMAGKSTFLRQNALISILAQVGSYVPAAYAEIGIVDQIFSRVGSADNLSQDQSTFMVEMVETAEILKRATPRSFVIMDEVGRGTTPEDGIAVSFACLHHLYHTNQCRTLFATHFHVLANMAAAAGMDKVGCYCTDVREGSNGAFSFIHRVRRGVNRQSHALKVALMAGLPQSAIDTASQVLESLHQRNLDATPQDKEFTRLEPPETNDEQHDSQYKQEHQRAY